MKKTVLAILFAGFGLTVQDSPAYAQVADRGTQASPAAPIAASDEWKLRLTAYGWLVNIAGNVTGRGQTVDVNASLIDIVQKSDSLAAWNSYFEADKGKFGFYTDLVWSRLQFSKSATAYRNPIAGLNISASANAALTSTMTIIEAGGVYELNRWPGDAGSFTALDALAGVRYWNLSADVNLDVQGTADFSNLGISGSRGLAVAGTGTMEWLDPLIGLRVRHQLTPNQDVMLRGDVGGFGVGSLFSWQAAAVYSYAWKFNGYSIAATGGYRALSTKYVNGTGIDTKGVDLVLHGPVIGVSLRF